MIGVYQVKREPLSGAESSLAQYRINVKSTARAIKGIHSPSTFAAIGKLIESSLRMLPCSQPSARAVY